MPSLSRTLLAFALLHSILQGQICLLLQVFLDFLLLYFSRWLQQTSQKRGREELPHVRGQGRQPRGATPRPRSGAVAERSNPTSKQRWLCGHRSAQRSYSTFKVRRGGGEEIPLVQGKEQRLRFAGAALRRYPTLKVRDPK